MTTAFFIETTSTDSMKIQIQNNRIGSNINKHATENDPAIEINGIFTYELNLKQIEKNFIVKK